MTHPRRWIPSSSEMPRLRTLLANLVKAAILSSVLLLSCPCLFVTAPAVEEHSCTNLSSTMETNGQETEPRHRVLGRNKNSKNNKIDFSENRIIGGSSVLDPPNRSFPFYVQIKRCGGTLVSESVVMTVRAINCLRVSILNLTFSRPLNLTNMNHHRRPTVTLRSRTGTPC